MVLGQTSVPVLLIMPFLQAGYIFEQRISADHRPENNIFLQRVKIRLEVGVGQKGFNFTAEYVIVGILKAEERLDSERIPGNENIPFLQVGDHEREHTVELRQALPAPALICRKYDLGVSMRLERVALLFQFAANLAVIVDFTVEDYGVTSVMRQHRLMSLRTEVDDAEPSEAEGEPFFVEEEAVVVRPAMGDYAGHFPESLLGETPALFRNYSYESAHDEEVLKLWSSKVLGFMLYRDNCKIDEFLE